MPLLPSIIREYRSKLDLTLEQLGAALVESLPEFTLTKQAVHNWESGKQSPGFQLLLLVTIKYSDWRRDFGFDCLAAMYPDYYQPATDAGRNGATQ